MAPKRSNRKKKAGTPSNKQAATPRTAAAKAKEPEPEEDVEEAPSPKVAAEVVGAKPSGKGSAAEAPIVVTPEPDTAEPVAEVVGGSAKPKSSPVPPLSPAPAAAVAAAASPAPASPVKSASTPATAAPTTPNLPASAAKAPGSGAKNVYSTPQRLAALVSSQDPK
jgi:hypothetical protein